ncbi:MAG: hypothetical protein KF767_08295 [Bdellovibrionaceae bacterium]|nr:hypothetical protein [Pseudobdellovibrionaceae bacterium]
MTGDFLKGRLSAQDVLKISDEVHRAEEGTWGEIVPMIVSQSTPGRSAEWTLTLVLLLLTGPLTLIDPGHWSFWLAEIALVAIAILLPPYVFRAFPSLRRRLIPREDLRAAVHGRAIVELENVRLRHTKKRTGVLLMVSWHERKVVVLGDEAVAQAVRPDEWEALTAEFADDLRSGRLPEGFTTAIRKVGQVLRKHFPCTGENADEIKNDLVIKI